eukprot:CAMPEP_0114168532 /NCGR_PEP_ID=MMETSP0043_2-20121206/33046_1 /TAXON_ID=464988 /ORGANISM="Hemiselmis andersenii, Strain CCMP644" /LENGTH=92 /DNA_ID=CAMNT_0001265855 /DNA_START=9 /DNA_END=284 /DNA_ORIENTATION=+
MGAHTHFGLPIDSYSPNPESFGVRGMVLQSRVYFACLDLTWPPEATRFEPTPFSSPCVSTLGAGFEHIASTSELPGRSTHICPLYSASFATS